MTARVEVCYSRGSLPARPNLASAATGGGPCLWLASRRAAGRLAGVAGGSGQPAQRAGKFIARRGARPRMDDHAAGAAGPPERRTGRRGGRNRRGRTDSDGRGLRESRLTRSRSEESE